MAFMWWIIDRLSDIGMWFYDVAVECWDSFYIPDIIGDLFYDIHGFFVGLAWDFVDFDDWLEWAADEIEDILSWSNIRSLIRGWLDGIEDLVDWFADWWDNVTDVIGEWWDSTRDTVRGWIDIAVEGLSGLLAAWDNFWTITWSDWISRFDDLKAAWDNFWTTVYPELVDFTWLGVWWEARLLDVQGLISSAFTLRESLWEGWQELRDQVTEFFADPLQWLYNKLDEFFERFW